MKEITERLILNKKQLLWATCHCANGSLCSQEIAYAHSQAIAFNCSHMWPSSQQKFAFGSKKCPCCTLSRLRTGWHNGKCRKSSAIVSNCRRPKRGRCLVGCQNHCRQSEKRFKKLKEFVWALWDKSLNSIHRFKTYLAIISVNLHLNSGFGFWWLRGCIAPIKISLKSFISFISPQKN